MAQDNAEGFHPVPSIRRARAASPLSGSKDAKPDASAEHGPVKRTEVEKHADGKAHVIAHHEDGHAETHQHANVQEAHDHASDLMAGGDSMGSSGQVDDDSEGECPECGGAMKDGTCQQCGYKAKAAAAMGGGASDDGDGY